MFLSWETEMNNKEVKKITIAQYLKLKFKKETKQS